MSQGEDDKEGKNERKIKGKIKMTRGEDGNQIPRCEEKERKGEDM